MKNKILTAAALSALAFTASAVPAYPGLIEGTQPDGTPITFTLHGDESFSWARSLDGFTLLRNDAGFWTLARRGDDGLLAPTKQIYSGKTIADKAAALGIPAMLPIDAKTASAYARAPRRAQASNLQVDATFPTTGKRDMLMLLVNFADTQTTYSASHFYSFMNAEGWKNIGSFRDFYLENSYGNLEINTTVTPWITLPYAKRMYTEDNVGDMIKYALESIADQIDLTKFDNDGDGILDGLAIIHQGAGQEATGSTSDIWSHSSVLYGLKVGGIEVRRYTIQPETFGNTQRISDIGVMCHEFGHNLGAPDFYDSDYGQSGGEFVGTGVWDLLGNGAWNGDYGDRPAHINMWQKIQFGWLTPTLLTETTQVLAMPDATDYPSAYRFNTTSPGDYFIIENRGQSEPFNSALPGSGLIITHVNEGVIAANVNANTVNASYPQGCYTVAANAGGNPKNDPSSYGFVNMPSALFPAGGTAFNQNTLPASIAVDGRASYCGLNYITQNADGSMAFAFIADKVPAAPRNLQAACDGADVRITWDSPLDPGVKGYNLYRNGEKIDYVSANTYTDRAPKGNKLTYTIDAVYADERVSPPVDIAIRVPQAKVTSLSADCFDYGVNLNIALDNNISRMVNPGVSTTDFQLREKRGTTVEFGHKFTAKDLATYAGMKIRRICFNPYQSLQECGYIIRVYEGSDGSYEAVSERQIKEMGTGIWNSILLTKAVEIKPGKDYIIALEVSPKTGVAQLVTEPSDILDGLGNMLRINGGEWTTDADAMGNFYLYAQLADAKSSDHESVAADDSEVDVDTDLFFPIGYRVYRDGQYVGETGTRLFIDSPRPAGMHTYTVTTLYKGGSETSHSAPLEVDCDKYSGIESIEAAAATEQPIFHLNGTKASGEAKGILLTPGQKIIR